MPGGQPGRRSYSVRRRPIGYAVRCAASIHAARGAQCARECDRAGRRPVPGAHDKEARGDFGRVRVNLGARIFAAKLLVPLRSPSSPVHVAWTGLADPTTGFGGVLGIEQIPAELLANWKDDSTLHSPMKAGEGEGVVPPPLQST